MQLCKHFDWSTTRELPEKPSTKEKWLFQNIEDSKKKKEMIADKSNQIVYISKLTNLQASILTNLSRQKAPQLVKKVDHYNLNISSY